MRFRRSLLVLPLLLAACAAPPAESSDAVLGFTPHPGAVEFPSATLDWVDETTGLLALVPVGDCVSGIGSYSTDTGDVPVNWSGERGCAKLVLGPVPEATPEAARPVTAAVALADGSIIAAGQKFARREQDDHRSGRLALRRRWCELTPDRPAAERQGPAGRARCRRGQPARREW